MGFVQEMFPTYMIKGEYWMLQKGSTVDEVIEEMQYYDGSIGNIVLNLNEYTKGDESRIFKTYLWVDKIMVIYENKIKSVLKRIKKDNE